MADEIERGLWTFLALNAVVIFIGWLISEGHGGKAVDLGVGILIACVLAVVIIAYIAIGTAVTSWLMHDFPRKVKKLRGDSDG